MSYQPIENYGIVGDTHTVALVGMNGSIDWFCYPSFDSPSVFGAILDAKKGGFFRIGPEIEGVRHKQLYWPDTNVLATRFLTDDGVGAVLDFMPMGTERRQLIRRVQVLRGGMRFSMECRPAFDYARAEHKTELTEAGVRFTSEDLALHLCGPMDMQVDGGAARASFGLEEGQTASFVLTCGECPPPTEDEVERLFRDTVTWWRHWLGQSNYKGRWREMVLRSALALKLMTYSPSGAIVAAPTCSLPAGIGGDRNWDYRYTWIRDAAFTLYALLRIGFTEEAANFMTWIEARCHELESDGSPLQVCYGIDGRHELTETELHHLEAYNGMGTVRVGNAAYNQLQLDIYGELLDSVYLYNKYGSPISYDLWKHLRRLINWVADNWKKEDKGIWEVRSGRQNFVYSKLMCWVALDRGIRLADKRSFPADRERWLATRDEIYEEIMKRGWNAKRGAFVQHYDSTTLDAANLLMPLVFFVSPTDPRMLSTLDAMLEPPHKGGLVSNSLVYRYNLEETTDGLEGEEGAFNICTFWLVEALTRAGAHDPARLEKARLIFEQMLGYANHLGLFSEQTGFSGEALGNFPQAFTHLSLISAAFNLDRTLGRSD